MSSIKKIQRRTVLQARNALTEDYQEYCSQKIAEFIFSLKVYQDAKAIALYKAVNREISLDAIFKNAINAGKTCAFPMLQPDKTLKFGIADDKTEFKKNRFDILEPEITDDEQVLSKAENHALCEDSGSSAKSIDLYFLPLVAFDKYGNRLGMGAGYYDRTLAAIHKPFCIGVAYSLQQLEKVATDKTDHKLDLIVTEKEIISCCAKTPKI